MKHSSLAIWLGLSSAFLALFSTFIALYAAQRKKAAAAQSVIGFTSWPWTQM